LAKKAIKGGYLPVFVFSSSIDEVPAIKRDLEDIGAKIELIPSSGKYDIAKSIFQLYRKYKPTIVHTHFVNYIILITAVYSKVSGAKHFTSFQSLISDITAKEYRVRKGIVKSLAIKLFYRILLCFSENIFATKPIDMQFIDFVGCNSNKIVNNLFLGVDCTVNTEAKETLRKKLSLPLDKVLLCNISAIEYIKGIDVWLKAVNLLIYKYNEKDFVFCHIGGLRSDSQINIDYRESLYTLVQELNISDNVLWLGHLDNIDSLGEILSAFDIYVHPSRMEGLGVANMEAATQSLPIVGSNIGGIPLIVHDGINGFLFESENSEQLAECLYKLITDENLRVKMGIESFRIVNKDFNIDLQTDKLLNYYLNR
jgi:glycosyltransferase involved in cell wall biosynthesis